MKEMSIYNLEFPPHVNELHIGDYKFKRAKNYKETLQGLQHLRGRFSEFDIKSNTGTHQITATVEIPDKEKPCVLPWGDENPTQLNDILLLLTLFSKRNVFLKDWEKELPIISDSRWVPFGVILSASIEREGVYVNIHDENDIIKNHKPGYAYVEIGFEKTINKILGLISTKEWQEKYEKGYFLFSYKHAIQRQIVETSFISCWTIWEHLFTLDNKKWLDDDSIAKMSGDKKITYVLSKYFSKEIDKKGREAIKKITKHARNRIIHFGKISDKVGINEITMFIDLTGQLMCIILGLKPKNILNTEEKIDQFLKGEPVQDYRLNL